MDQNSLQTERPNRFTGEHICVNVMWHWFVYDRNEYINLKVHKYYNSNLGTIQHATRAALLVETAPGSQQGDGNRLAKFGYGHLLKYCAGHWPDHGRGPTDLLSMPGVPCPAQSNTLKTFPLPNLWLKRNWPTLPWEIKARIRRTGLPIPFGYSQALNLHCEFQKNCLCSLTTHYHQDLKT